MKAMRHLAALGGALCALMAAADARPIGTVVGVPSWELNRFVQVNTFPPFGEPANNVTVLHVSPEFNAAIVTVALTRRGTGLPAATLYVPTYGTDTIARIWRQINAADVWSLGRKLASGYGSVLKVGVSQPYAGNYTPGAHALRDRAFGGAGGRRSGESARGLEAGAPTGGAHRRRRPGGGAAGDGGSEKPVDPGAGLWREPGASDRGAEPERVAAGGSQHRHGRVGPHPGAVSGVI
jgi:hypothetical protein